MSQINMRNNGSELVLNTKLGKYVAYGPLQPGREKFDVELPDGSVSKMSKAEFLKLIVENTDLERTPQEDCFEKGS